MMMRKLTVFAAIALIVGMASPSWAINCPRTSGPTTSFACTQTVFNDSGSDLTSGSVVIWDNDDTEFDRSGYPYVTTTTTADHPWVAGITTNPNCLDQTLCEIVVYGFAWARVADSTTAATEDDLVGTSTVAGQLGDYTAGTADDCAIGKVLELYEKDSNVDPGGVDNSVFPIWVSRDCE